MEGSSYRSMENEESETSVDDRNGGKNEKGGNKFRLNVDLVKCCSGNGGNCSDLPEINVSFSNLSYSVKHGLKRESKIILNKLHGKFLSGELSAIMGPSGSGKTTLMNILAGFTTSGIDGIIMTNGAERELRAFARHSCYIMQDDQLCPLVTVEEALILAAHLKLGSKIKGKSEKVKTLLKSLGLYSCRNSLTGKLSGGEKKRLAIAVELISNPPVLFFDEPTSGLDSSTSKQCISVLKELATSGRTVICTIHQPSASLFEMFDYVYAMRNGRCLYSGGTDRVVPFLRESGLHCPHHHNPADYILEIAATNEYSEKLAFAIDNGKCTRWRRESRMAGEKLYPEKEKQNENKVCNNSKMPNLGYYPCSFFTQLYVLTMRNLKQIYRNKVFAYLQLCLHLLFGVLMGTLFYNIGNDAAHVSHNYGLIFFCIMLNMFTSYSAAMSHYPQEFAVLVREHFNKWYSLKAHLLAINISAFPLQVFCSLIYMSIVYFMSGQPLEMDRYVKTISIIVLIAFIGHGFGYFVSSVLSVQNASILGALITAPFMLFSGFFVHIPDSPGYLNWLFHTSYFKYGLEGMMIALFGDRRPKMNCSEDYCHFVFPSKFLRQIGMEFSDYWFSFAVLLCIGIFLRLTTYYSLSLRIKYFRNY